MVIRGSQVYVVIVASLKQSIDLGEMPKKKVDVGVVVEGQKKE